MNAGLSVSVPRPPCFLAKTILLLCATVLLMLAMPASAAAQDIDRLLIVAVLDGDSIRLRRHNGERFELRLAAIDAPEQAQRFSDSSRHHLIDLMRDCTPHVLSSKRDRYYRQVGTLTCTPTKGEPFDVGLAQVAAGMAWHFSRYAGEQEFSQRRAYADAQQRARQRGIGLWADAAPLPPWEYRRTHAGQARKLRKY